MRAVSVLSLDDLPEPFRKPVDPRPEPKTEDMLFLLLTALLFS